MNRETMNSLLRSIDGLRLIGLGRIPRCAGCARYGALIEVQSASPATVPLPPVPATCGFQVCAPLVRRHFGPDPAAEDGPRSLENPPARAVG